MNKIYRLIWNEINNTWVAVPETTKSSGKLTSRTVDNQSVVDDNIHHGMHLAQTSANFLLKTITASLMMIGLVYAAPPVNELPTGGSVSQGSATISQSGNTMNINQTTGQAAVNWNTFNVGSQATVNIQQPGTSSVLLNRVMDVNPSQIFGRINANGQVFFTNPNGIHFAPGSSLNVGGITATTHSISDADFMSGNYNFSRNGATGSIINEGNITADINGYVALLAPEVRNNGVIVAQLGTVALAAGEAFELQFDSNNTLANIRVEPSTIQALVENGNVVHAPGGASHSISASVKQFARWCSEKYW
jgi:filamentous hemagglutinin family protein